MYSFFGVGVGKRGATMCTITRNDSTGICLLLLPFCIVFFLFVIVLALPDWDIDDISLVNVSQFVFLRTCLAIHPEVVFRLASKGNLLMFIISNVGFPMSVFHGEFSMERIGSRTGCTRLLHGGAKYSFRAPTPLG